MKYKENVLVHTPTQKQFNTVLLQIAPHGISNNKWEVYKNDTCVYPFNKRYSAKSWIENMGYTVISYDQFMKECTTSEIGKWYKTTVGSHTYYCKYEYNKNGGMRGNAYLWKYHEDYVFESGYNWIPVTDLSEIQHFLPEDHIDKFPTHNCSVIDKKHIYGYPLSEKECYKSPIDIELVKSSKNRILDNKVAKINALNIELIKSSKNNLLTI